MFSSLSFSLSIYLWFYSPLDLGRFFSFLNLYTVGRTPWTGDQPVCLTTYTKSNTLLFGMHYIWCGQHYNIRFIWIINPYLDLQQINVKVKEMHKFRNVVFWKYACSSLEYKFRSSLNEWCSFCLIFTLSMPNDIYVSELIFVKQIIIMRFISPDIASYFENKMWDVSEAPSPSSGST
jgi:hypothetical protein